MYTLYYVIMKHLVIPGPLLPLPIGATFDIFSPDIWKGLGTHHLLWQPVPRFYHSMCVEVFMMVKVWLGLE